MAMCPTPLNSDLYFMQRALDLAKDVRGHVWPNPPVGCVIVKDAEVVANAATHPGGRPHAERTAIGKAGAAALGATLYVTLEPCCHWGKTPPCTDAIIEAGVARVVCAVQDPDPRVNGIGFRKLRDAGIEVAVGLCSQDAQHVMSGFFHRVRFGAPELVALTDSSDLIPDGIDGILASETQRVVLTTRSDMLTHEPQPQDQLLRWMGELGLTTVAISKPDPFWNEDRSPQAASAFDVSSKGKVHFLRAMK